MKISEYSDEMMFESATFDIELIWISFVDLNLVSKCPVFF